ncbi:hypothetical protein [Vreelandella populi]|uniref:hypothetical protein n=1 Tax=Vreelandella populi TaxID=2498858 RepID=UPI000F8E5AE1|nr:hypothetical protein [Halomonas populi]RUR52688.1 hypothetical protein ELY40_11600 [Halomonas populi]
MSKIEVMDAVFYVQNDVDLSYLESLCRTAANTNDFEDRSVVMEAFSRHLLTGWEEVSDRNKAPIPFSHNFAGRVMADEMRLPESILLKVKAAK